MFVNLDAVVVSIVLGRFAKQALLSFGLVATP